MKNDSQSGVSSLNAPRMRGLSSLPDRDGKYQLGTLKESAFDPLSRTCEFMHVLTTFAYGTLLGPAQVAAHVYDVKR
jgi:hypothetical protein